MSAMVDWESPPAPTDPFAALLDRYVLWAIGALTEDEAAKLEAIAPKLTKLYGGDGSWHGALGVAMRFPETMPTVIQERWRHNQEIAARKGRTLPAAVFARMFVAANFGPGAEA